MNSGSWAVTCCACAEAVNANAAIEKINFFISVSLSLAPGYYHLPLVNVRLAKRGGAKPQIICTHRPSHCHSARILVWSTPRCVYIRNLSRPSFPGRERVQFTLWGIPVRLSSGWVCEVHECRLLQLRLNAVVHIDAKHHVCKDTKKCCIYQTFFDLFFTSKKPFFHFFLQQKKGRYIFIFYFYQ